MKYLPIFALCILFFSCSGDYSPKPFGYFRIDLQDPVYQRCTDFSSFSFNIPQSSTIEVLPDTTNEEWFNIVYPQLNAKIYCSFLQLNSHGDLIKISEDSRKFVYKHVIKADGISEQSYAVPDNAVHAIIYDIDGNVATPLQFVVTDSVHYFLRGSLYFNAVPNQDSIAPVTKYIRRDVEEIIRSFKGNSE